MLRSASVTLVCKRWRQVFLEEPHVWRSLWLGQGALLTPGASFRQWLAGKHRLLQLAGRHVAAIAVDDSWGRMGEAASSAPAWHIGRLLSPQRLPALRELSLFLDQSTLLEPAAAAHALARLTRLTRLRISADWLPAAPAAALSSLTALQDVCCSAQHLLEELPAAIARLPLTQLSLESTWEVMSTEPLQGLSRLHSLTVRCQAIALRLPHPGRFPLLSSFLADGSHYSHGPGKFEVRSTFQLAACKPHKSVGRFCDCKWPHCCSDDTAGRSPLFHSWPVLCWNVFPSLAMVAFQARSASCSMSALG